MKKEPTLTEKLELIINHGEYCMNYRLQELFNRGMLLDTFGNVVGFKEGAYPRHHKWVDGKLIIDYTECYFCDMHNEPRPQVGILNFEEWKLILIAPQ